MGLIDRDLAPGLARLAIGAWWRTGVWTAETTYRASRRLAKAATSGSPPSRSWRTPSAR